MAFLSTTLSIYRASLHPQGFAAVTENFGDWARHLVQELLWLRESTADADLAALAEEVLAYPNVAALGADEAPDPGAGLLLTCVMRLAGQRVALFTTRAT